jgi:hypothetical protein
VRKKIDATKPEIFCELRHQKYQAYSPHKANPVMNWYFLRFKLLISEYLLPLYKEK